MNITNEELGEIIASMDTVYTFVVESHNDYATPRDYGNGKMMNMSAIHTLTIRVLPRQRSQKCGIRPAAPQRKA